jgi:hypothetical protein
MITAMISTILGMVGGVLPDIMKEVRDSRSASREIEFLRMQAELQMKVAAVNADARLREIDAGIVSQEMQATREHLTAIIEAQAKPTGIKWIDGYNAVLRPMCTTLIILLFMGTAIPFVWAVLSQMSAGAITAVQMANIIWGSMVGESILGVLGFLFGARSSMKRS